RNGNNAFDAELLHAVDVGTEVEFGRHDAVAASMTRQKSDFATFECAQDVCVGRRSEGSFQLLFVYIGEAGHGVQSTPSDDSNFSFLQLNGSGELGMRYLKLYRRLFHTPQSNSPLRCLLRTPSGMRSMAYRKVVRGIAELCVLRNRTS